MSIEHSLFVDSDEYDSHIEATEAGWPAFLRILQLYMAHHRGQPCTLLELMGATSEEFPGMGQSVLPRLDSQPAELGARFALRRHLRAPISPAWYRHGA